MNVSLTPKLEALVQEKVDSGLYNNSSEVIREALRLMHDRDRHDSASLEVLAREARLGFQALDRGEVSKKSVARIAKEARSRRKPRVAA
jgi:antitoxin ParD1/3/4